MQGRPHPGVGVSTFDPFSRNTVFTTSMIPGRRVLLALLVSHAWLLMMCQAGGELGTVGMTVGEANKGGDRATESLAPKRHDRLRRLGKGYGHAHGVGKGHHGDSNNAGGSGCGHGGNGWGHQHPDFPNNGNGSVGSGAAGGLLPVCTYTLDPRTDCSAAQGQPGQCTRECPVNGSKMCQARIWRYCMIVCVLRHAK